MLEGFGAGREVRADSATRRPRLTDIVLCAPGFESDDDGQEFSLQELAAQHAERERIV